MALPTITVECAFGSTWQTASPTWTDVTAYVLDDGVRWSRGRGRDSDSIQAGTASLTFRNRDHRFTPGYTAGPYGADVIPMVPIQILAEWDSVSYTVFSGLVREWVPDWTNPANPTVRADCVDAVRVFGQTFVESPYSARLVPLAPTYHWRLNEQFSFLGYVRDVTGNGHIGLNDAGADPSVGDGAPIRPGAAGSFDLGDNTSAFPAAVKTMLSSSQISGTTSFTLSCWWDGDARDMTGGIGNLRKFYDQAASAFNYVYIAFNSSTNKFEFGTYDSPTLVSVTSTNTFSSSWGPTFIVAVRTATALELYVNGTLEGSVAAAPVSLSAATPSAYWGRTTTSTGQNMRGRLSNVVVDVDSAWDATSIASLWRAGQGWHGEPPTTRVGRVLDAVGWPTANRWLDPIPAEPHNPTTFNFPSPAMAPWPEDTNALQLIQDAVSAIDGDFFISRDGLACFRDWHTRAVSPRATVATTMPSGYWPLNETSGTTCYDRHAEIQGTFADDTLWMYVPADGTYQNTPTLDYGTMLETPEQSVLDTSVRFAAASSEYVSVTYPGFQVDGDQGFVVGAWVNIDDFSAVRPVIAKSDATNSDWWMYVDTSGRLRVGYVNASSVTREVTGPTLTTGDPYVVLGAFSKGLGRLTAAAVGPDGVWMATTAGTSMSDTVRLSMRDVWIGRRHSDYMNGQMSHVFFTPRAVGTTELAFGIWRAGMADPELVFASDDASVSGLPFLHARYAQEEQRIRNIVRVTVPAVTISGLSMISMFSQVEDAASASVYGARYEDRAAQIEYPVFSIDALTWRLMARQSRPRLRTIELTTSGSLSPDVLWPKLLGLELSAKARVVQGSRAGSSETMWGYVDRIEFEMSRSDWTTTIQLAPY